MRKALAWIGVALALAALGPVDVEAVGARGMAPSRGAQGQSFRGQSFHGRPFPGNSNWSNFHRSHHHRSSYYRPFYYPYYSSYYSPFYSTSPSYDTQQSYPGYGGAPYGYGAPSGSLDLAPAPQIEREVVFPEGRYVLLGDGEATPFHWVWVPNPPTAPPSEPQDRR